MALIARLTHNSLGWTKPTGTDCKDTNSLSPYFEAKYNYGFEEWLFKESHKCFLKDQGHYLGFVEMGKSGDSKVFDGSPVYLFTETFSNEDINSPQQTKRLVGSLNGCSLITLEDMEIVGKVQYEQWYKEMKIELSEALMHDDRRSSALERFDEEFEKRNLFNVKFTSAYRFDLPRSGRNWSYLKIQTGAIGALPGTFKISEISTRLVRESIDLNGGRIPQILPPF
jgi:hypothetical protein